MTEFIIFCATVVLVVVTIAVLVSMSEEKK